MCGLFGFSDYGHQLNPKQLNDLIDALATESAIRGTDATGIAYLIDDKLEIEKEPKSAYEMTVRLPKETRTAIGHTRHSTQGSSKKRYNNHPFRGRLKNGGMFVLAHNGIISNDKALRKKHDLPDTKIETDSYIAVQLLERNKELSFQTIRDMAEELTGSFTFSILDDRNGLWLAKGDNPLEILHLTGLGLYVYASTEQILWRALTSSLLSELKAGRFEEVPFKEGEILCIEPNGNLSKGAFDCRPEVSGLYDWLGYPWSCCPRRERDNEDTYLAELKSVAGTFGCTPSDVERLIQYGYTPEEIEELLYSGDCEYALTGK